MNDATLAINKNTSDDWFLQTVVRAVHFIPTAKFLLFCKNFVEGIICANNVRQVALLGHKESKVQVDANAESMASHTMTYSSSTTTASASTAQVIIRDYKVCSFPLTRHCDTLVWNLLDIAWTS